MTTSEEPSKHLLHLLPVELLLIIKDHISPYDLRTHVYFYKTCPRVAGVYGTGAKENTFWEQTCWFAGIGQVELDDGEPDWKKMAFNCIEEDGFCDHDQCGASMLEKNASNKGTSLMNAPGGSRRRPRFVENSIFEHITFKPKTQRYSFNHTFAAIEYSHIHRYMGTERVVLDSYKSKMQSHPLAYRSFATFPPVQEMCFDTLLGVEFDPIERSTGVTVGDVLTAFYSKLDVTMDPELVDEHLRENMGFYTSRIDDLFSSDEEQRWLEIALHFRRLRT